MLVPDYKRCYTPYAALELVYTSIDPWLGLLMNCINDRVKHGNPLPPVRPVIDPPLPVLIGEGERNMDCQ